ncbi:MAG: FAD:protein FMN transferase [Burkholderiaceae bacterium]
MTMRHVLVPSLISPDAPPRGRVQAVHGQTMGTSWSVRFVSDAPNQEASLKEVVQCELDQVVAQMSHWEPQSNLGRYNAGAAGSWHDLPEAFYEVLGCAIDIAAQSRGAYDPAAGAIVNAWGFGPNGKYRDREFLPPSPEQIAEAMQYGNWESIAIADEHRKVFQPGGLQLDLSAIAKGYGVDRVAQCLDEQGLHHYLVDVGGELRGAGVKPDGQPWWVGIEQVQIESKHPTQCTEETILALHGLSVASSGDYRRYAEIDGRRYAHTLDPRTGHPIANDVASVTVIHPSCMKADALSTALTVLDVEEGMRFAEDRKLAARFIVRQSVGLQEHATSAWKDMLQ